MPVRNLRRVVFLIASLGLTALAFPGDAPCVDCPVGKKCLGEIFCRPRLCPDLSCRIVDSARMEKRCIRIAR